MYTDSPYVVNFDGHFSIDDCKTSENNIDSKANLKKQLKSLRKRFAKLQRVLYAQNKYSLLLVFQAMDAGGKDSTIRHITKGVNPAGFQVFSFKQPSSEELDHDFLWRSAKSLPERGRIGIFNRSYYEETLVVRVHPEYLKAQRLPLKDSLIDNGIPDDFWQKRFRSIREHERHLHENGTIILKFWLNVSANEQKQRFISRLENPDKYWKFSQADIDERQHWSDYMRAYEDMLKQTSREYAPWFAIPADNKPYMRMVVAQTIVNTLENLPLQYPKPKADSGYYEEMLNLLKANNIGS